jgi:uncharacterized protein (DUF1015 family)
MSGYNMINLTLPNKARGQNQYQRAARRFHKWLKNGVLIQDEKPAIYFYQQEFKLDEEKNSRRGKGAWVRRLGFIACLGLHSHSSIYGHERTRIELKEDRFRLLVKVQANLEPIFLLYSDPQGFLESIFKEYASSSKPLVCFRGQEKNINTLWRLTEPAILKSIKRKMANKSLFIADGHHRYEVSLKYQNLMRKKLSRQFRADEDFNYIMAYFCPLQSKGLLVNSVLDLKEILRLAKLGRKLPPKSTYFYPKVLSGMVIYKFR